MAFIKLSIMSEHLMIFHFLASFRSTTLERRYIFELDMSFEETTTLFINRENSSRSKFEVSQDIPLKLRGSFCFHFFPSLTALECDVSLVSHQLSLGRLLTVTSFLEMATRLRRGWTSELSKHWTL